MKKNRSKVIHIYKKSIHLIAPTSYQRHTLPSKIIASIVNGKDCGSQILYKLGLGQMYKISIHNEREYSS